MRFYYNHCYNTLSGTKKLITIIHQSLKMKDASKLESSKGKIPKVTDWLKWSEALQDHIDQTLWNYMTDPDNNAESDELYFMKRSKFPRHTDVRADAATRSLSTKEKETFLNLVNEHRARCDEYDRQEEENLKLNTFLEMTVDRYVYEEIKRLNPREKYVALKEHFCPDGNRIGELIRRDWDELNDRDHRSVDKWIFDWKSTYNRAKANGVDLGGEEASVRAINEATKRYIPELYFKNREILKAWSTTTIQRTFDQFANEIKERMIMQEEISGPPEPKKSSKVISKRPRDDELPSKPQPKECLCGQRHWYRDCYYLNPAKRPPAWKENAETRRRIDERLKSDETTKARVKRAIENFKAKEPSQSKDKEPLSFSFMTTTDESILGRVILDSGSNLHITGHISRFELQSYKELTQETTVQTGSGTVTVVGYGTMIFRAQGIDGTPRDVRIADTAYAPEFAGSVVSTFMLKKKGYHVDTINERIVEHDPTTGIITPRLKYVYQLGQQIFDLPDQLASFSVTEKPLKKDKYTLWHNRLGHPCPITVEKSAGVTCPKGEICHACDVGKATRVISEVPRNRATVPFQRLHLDIVQMEMVRQTKEQFFAHLTCDMTRMHFVSVMAHKSQVTEAVIEIVTLIESQFELQVKTIRSDNETSLGNEFNAWIRDKGMVLEFSAPRCPQQNGNAERAGGVITTKARTMMIHAGIPPQMWPHGIMTAVYLLNRLPSRVLNWMSPIECCNVWKRMRLERGESIPTDMEALANETLPVDKPSIKHLKAFGCETIVTDLEIPKSKKIQARAYVGYLVGYNSSNIFKVWVPSKNKVVAARDVTFHENRFIRDRDNKENLDDDQPEPIEEPKEVDDNPQVNIMDQIYGGKKTGPRQDSTTTVDFIRANPRIRKKAGPVLSLYVYN